MNLFYPNPPLHPTIQNGMRKLLLAGFALCLCVHVQAQFFDYGTGQVASNATPFNTGDAAVLVEGNNVTVVANTTIAAGTYHFNNFTINEGVTLTVTGTGA